VGGGGVALVELRRWTHAGRLEPDPVGGVKGALLDLIDRAISELM